MIFDPTGVAGAYLITPEPHRDDRGFFARIWCQDEFARHGLSSAVAQVNVGFSPRRGTLRGMHYQVAPHLESKLVGCTRGAAFDVVIDLRPDSPSFRRWHAAELTETNGCMLYVPEGCAHGYLTLRDDTEVRYQASVPFASAASRGVRFDDPAFGVTWPEPISIISDRDRSWPDFES